MLFSYWSGPIGWMERLSVDSALAVGHEVTVYTHDPDALSQAGLGCAVADAWRITDPPKPNSSLSHFSDAFRVEGLAKGCGTWFDLDIVFLRALPSDPYLFGMMGGGKIGNSMLRLPADCPMLAEYVALCRNGRTSPPWYPLHSRVGRYLKGAARQLLGGKPALPIYGPRTLTHLVQKHGLSHLAKPQPVFYPIGSDKRLIADMLEWPAKHIKPETVCVHLWRSSWKDCHGAAMPSWANSGNEDTKLRQHLPARHAS